MDFMEAADMVLVMCSRSYPLIWRYRRVSPQVFLSDSFLEVPAGSFSVIFIEGLCYDIKGLWLEHVGAGQRLL